MIEETNVDNIFLRNAMIAVMDNFADNITTKQVVNGKEDSYPIVVKMRSDNDDQFMLDYFVQYKNKCRKINQHAEGDFDKYPQIILDLPKVSVVTGNMTNKFVRGNTIIKEVDKNGYDVDNEYSMMLYALPISMKVKCECHVKSLNQSFRTSQDIWDSIYKNTKAYFAFRGQRIQMNISIEDDHTLNKKQDFKFTGGDGSEHQSIEFNLDIETYYPVFDKSTSIWMGDVIDNFRIFIYEKQSKEELMNKKIDENYGIEQ